MCQTALKNFTCKDGNVRTLERSKIKALECTFVRITYKVLFFIWFGLILFFSVVPHGSDDHYLLSRISLTRSGFFQHVFAYFVLSALACLAFGKKRRWLYLVGIVLTGGFFEIIQFYLPYRTFNVYDIVANGVGAVLFIIGWMGL